MIDLNTLRYFTSAFETGTFSQAARANGVSQPTVSAAIQKLEDKLRAPLFQRSKSGLTPTTLARRLYHDAEQSVTHLSTLENRLRDEPQKIVRVHCALDILIRGIAPGLNSLRRQSDALVFSFTAEPQDSDIAYVSDICVPDNHAFIPLADEPFRVAAARFHPLAAQTGVRLADLVDHPLIQRPYCPNADHMKLGSVQVSAAARAMNDTQLLELVAAGLGIAFVPRSHADGRDDIAVLPLLDADAGTRRIGISHRKSAFAKGLAERLTLT
ncbi:LysR family transcriptional regulator [Sedimentitalea nanhaiensis]|uniref:DNA-binding transcriptional regulator, LysR family n=1 Tax=Sedimentitalea nanhaiensis TaxID=999627 RepID=A0A1I6X507_9RHOB|nr:LysR family transcriptional regulator [Sedimentitalea nanhaiensis]SFT33415.1 DNA-binding transcriptional regulator, LysR family [Sedimentitalea nanhaiensis]